MTSVPIQPLDAAGVLSLVAMAVKVLTLRHARVTLEKPFNARCRACFSKLGDSTVQQKYRIHNLRCLLPPSLPIYRILSLLVLILFRKSVAESFRKKARLGLVVDHPAPMSVPGGLYTIQNLSF